MISDQEYDKKGKYLYKLIQENPNEFKESEYYYMMYDYNPATGFDLRDRLNDKDREKLIRIANRVVWLYEGERKIKKK